MHDFTNQRVTVMGLGRFGGGLGVTRYLAGRGAEILLTDKASPDTLAAPLAEIDDLVREGAVTLRLGEHNVADFTTPDAVVINPAVPTPWDNRFVRAARAASIPILTEIGLTLDLIAEAPGHSKLIAITGTAGKSTTSAMIHAALAGAGFRALLGGNIGGSLLARAAELPGADAIVLEISSAQLHWLEQHALAPRVAVVTSFAPNHIDWHGSLGHYLLSKQSILRSAAHAVLGPGVHDWPAPNARTLIAEPARIALAIPGAHNRLNAALALGAIDAFGATPDKGALASFPGLPHRLHRLPDRGGVRFFDDSKSTTPEATALALRALAEDGFSRIHLIAGGADKGVDLAPMFTGATNIASVHAIGATAPALCALRPDTEEARTLDAAVAGIARSHAREGDTVLLSPGCASWDQFSNYEQRGHAFAEAVSRSF